MVMLLAPCARAEPPNAPGYGFGAPAGEIGLSVAAVLSLGSYLLPQNRTAWRPASMRRHHQGYATATDFTGSLIGASWQIAGSYGLESGYLADHGAADPELRALRTALVDVEATLLTTGITLALKRATGRCRPRAWSARGCSAESEYTAFPSGHTSLGSAVAGSRLMIAVRSNGDPSKRYLAFGFAEAATLATAALRVLAGAHSWEDVVAGWGVGHATGALVALVHPMQSVQSVEQHSAMQAPLVSQATATVGYSGRF